MIKVPHFMPERHLREHDRLFREMRHNIVAHLAPILLRVFFVGVWSSASAQ